MSSSPPVVDSVQMLNSGFDFPEPSVDDPQPTRSRHVNAQISLNITYIVNDSLLSGEKLEASDLNESFGKVYKVFTLR